MGQNNFNLVSENWTINGIDGNETHVYSDSMKKDLVETCSFVPKQSEITSKYCNKNSIGKFYLFSCELVTLCIKSNFELLLRRNFYVLLVVTIMISFNYIIK